MKDLILKITACNVAITEKITDITELKSKYGSRNQFYKKAHILTTGSGIKILKSYESFVSIIINDNIYINNSIDKVYSNTTLRHIKEFIKQFSRHENKHNYKINDIKKFYDCYIIEV